MFKAKICLQVILLFLLNSCAQQSFKRNYSYDNQNIIALNKSIVVAKIYNKTSYGMLGSSLPILIEKASQALTKGEAQRTQINVKARIFLSNNKSTFILGEQEEANKKQSFYVNIQGIPLGYANFNPFMESHKLLSDPEKHYLYNPKYDVIILDPGVYKINKFEYWYFNNIDNLTSSVKYIKDKQISFTLQAGEVIYLGDIETVPERNTIMVHNKYNDGLEFMDQNYPKISHKLRIKELQIKD